MTFWGTNLDATSQDPKRKFRFKVQLGALGEGVVWYAKTVDKPELTISADASHKFLGHTFKYPGSVSWNDINMTLVDPIGEEASTKLLQIIEQPGYVFPRGGYQTEGQLNGRAFETISKGKSKAALGAVVITQIDADGNTVEKWTLHNPFINKVGFGDLSYEAEDLSEISLGITYDWAEYSQDESDPVIFKRANP